MFALLILILAPIAAMLIQFAISRSREFEADRGGAEISGDPKALADALAKIDRYARGLPLEAAEAHPATAQMMIVNPLSGGGVRGLFCTHPATEERIRRLARHGVADHRAAGVQQSQREAALAVHAVLEGAGAAGRARGECRSRRGAGASVRAGARLRHAPPSRHARCHRARDDRAADSRPPHRRAGRGRALPARTHAATAVRRGRPGGRRRGRSSPIPARSRWSTRCCAASCASGRTCSRASDADPVARWSHPRWWIARLRADWPDDWASILDAGNARPPLTLRVNRRRGERAALLRAIRRRRHRCACRGRRGNRRCRAAAGRHVARLRGGRILGAGPRRAARGAASRCRGRHARARRVRGARRQDLARARDSPTSR